MKERYVGLTPYADWYSFFSFSRICTTLDMSTSIAEVTCAEVSSERRMWSAIPRRIAVMGSSVSPVCADAGAAGCAGCGVRGGRCSLRGGRRCRRRRRGGCSGCGGGGRGGGGGGGRLRRCLAAAF